VWKKLLVIFGIAAVAGYVFRDRLAAGALELGGKLNQIQEDLGWGAVDEDDEGTYFDVTKEKS
jgi:hypothetical protein